MTTLPPFHLIDDALAGPFGDTPIGRFLRDRGTRLPGAARPAGLARGTPRKCYENSTELAFARGLDYWEGWGFNPEFGAVAIDHAWCRDPATGKVVDATWAAPETCVYLGVHIPTPTLFNVIVETRIYGVLQGNFGFARDVVARHLGWSEARGTGRRDRERARARRADLPGDVIAA